MRTEYLRDMRLRKALYRQLRTLMLRLCPEKVADRDWRKWKGYGIDWENPRDINEKIQWLMYRSDTTKWSELADKYKVREYVASKGLEGILIPLLGVWKKAGDIDFESLPDKFVLKCNHDSGSTIIVDKSNGFNPDEIRATLDRHLRVKYGFERSELYYNRIKPLILAEKYLEPDDPSISASPVDYKIWCFDGKPYSVWACSDRTSDSVYVNTYDLDWNVHPEVSIFTDHYRDGGGRVPRPACLDEMLDAAGKLSEGFPEVRVDFYEVGGKLYFGEMTFASLNGKMDFYTQEYLKELGDQCILPRKA